MTQLTVSRSLLDSPQNVRMRAYLLGLLEDRLTHLCRPECWVRVTMSFYVQDGTIQSDVTIKEEYTYRTSDILTPETLT